MNFCGKAMCQIHKIHRFSVLPSPCLPLYPKNMAEPQKISLYRVRQAYDLNEHEAQALLNALSPHGIFPCAVWHEAYSLFWEKPAAECTVQCGAENPPFPEYAPASTPLFPVDSYATLMTDFFFEMARRVPVKELEKGFDYILEASYNDKSYLSDNEREYIFYSLIQAERRIVDYRRTKRVKDISIQLSAPNILLRIYPDTIAVDTQAAIRHLSVHKNFPFGREVKGITRRLVETVIKAAETSEIIAGQSPQENIPVSSSLWKGKSPEAIRTAMRESGFDNDVIAHVLFFKRGIRKQRDIGRLLGAYNLSDSAYDKTGKELFEKASRIKVIDTE